MLIGICFLEGKDTKFPTDNKPIVVCTKIVISLAKIFGISVLEFPITLTFPTSSKSFKVGGV